MSVAGSLLAALAAATICAAVPALADVTVYVAPNGSDRADGSRARPFATLERARDAIRRSGSAGRRTVVLRAGTYERTAAFTLGKDDSGDERHPVVWTAEPGRIARIVGGRSIPSSAFHSVSDAAVLARLDAGARPNVVAADLGALGVKLPEAFPVTYHGAPPGPELFFNGARMTLARWPNSGWTTIERIVDSGSCPREGDKTRNPGVFEYAGDRPARWKADEGVWLQGYWCFDWYDEVIRIGAIDTAARRITLAAPHLYGVRQGNPSPRRFRALNLLEELDTPGEFYVDRARGTLYFWPPSKMDGARMELSTLDQPLIAIDGARNVTVRGLTLTGGLDDGIVVTDCVSCTIDRCVVTNMRRQGIRVVGGEKDRVLLCDIHDTGTGGLVLSGGDRKTLRPAEHQAIANHIWRFSVHQLTGAYGLTFGGVGNRAANNLIHDAPHQAILVGGNDHVFELNEVHHVCTETDDCGALYKGRNPSCRGNVIRFNYWHDIGSEMGHGSAAIYLDDGDGGDLVFGNVFYRCGDPGRGSFGTVFSHGGHDNRAENNIFIECKRALGSAPWDDKRWRAALKGAEETFFPEKLLREVDITRPPYTVRYPELVGFMDPPVGAARVNHARRNVMVRCGEVKSGAWDLAGGANLVTGDDPGFVNAARHDFRLKRDAAVYRLVPGFSPIPFDRIGLPKGARRSTAAQ